MNNGAISTAEKAYAYVKCPEFIGVFCLIFMVFHKLLIVFIMFLL